MGSTNSTQLSRKITGIKKNSKTWDLHQSILYTSAYYFFKKQNFLTQAFFSTDQLVALPYKAKWRSRGEITKGSAFWSDRILWKQSYSIFLYPTLEKKCGQVSNTYPHWIRRGNRMKKPCFTLLYCQICFSSFPI